MEERWALYLDLDDTLVLTSAIAHLRRQRQWQQAYAAFPLTMLPPGTPRFLEDAARYAQLGVITRTPRPYAEKLPPGAQKNVCSRRLFPLCFSDLNIQWVHALSNDFWLGALLLAYATAPAV